MHPLDTASLAAAARILGSAHPNSLYINQSDLIGCVVPAAPDQGLANLMVRPPGAPSVTLDEIDRLYRDAGVTAWQLFALGDCADDFEAAGYIHGKQLAAMTADLTRIDPPDTEGLSVTRNADVADLGAINARAYPAPGLDRAFTATPSGLRVYAVVERAAPVSVVASLPLSDGDLGLYFAATLPAARRRGLATRLIGMALSDARADGYKTASLQAQTAGLRVYTSLGFRSRAVLTPWDRLPIGDA